MQKLAFRRTCPTDRAFDGLCFDQHGAFVVQNSSHGRSAPLPSPPRTVTDGVAVSARDQVDHLVQQGGLQHDGQQDRGPKGLTKGKLSKTQLGCSSMWSLWPLGLRWDLE